MRIKKLISLLLAVLLLCGGIVGLFGCADDGGAGETEATSDGTENTDAPAPETEAPIDPLKLIENGASEYVVVYPNDASTVILSAAEFLVSQIESRTGVRLKSKTDNLRGKDAHDPNEKAILLGRTNYEESQEVLDTLERFEYKIAQVGNKLVVTALEDPYILTAVKYYAANLLDPNLSGETGSKTLLSAEYHFVPDQSNLNSLSINGQNVTEFSIVYPKGNAEYEKIANTLNKIVEERTGVLLPLYADADRETANEILIGKTSRALSQSLYSEKKYIMEYSLEVSGKKMQILGGGYFSTEQCVYEFRFSMLNNGVLDLTDGSHKKTNLLTSSPALSDGADIRLMTANILHQAWDKNGRNEVPYRAEMMAGLLRCYKPDAVGLQEASGEWQTELSKRLTELKEEYGLDYTWHHKKVGGKTNFSGILFRADLYECVSEKTHVFSYWSNSYHMRIITMCKLQSKTDSSKQFIMMNTHWDTDDSKKVKCAAQSTTFLNNLKSQNCPIFFSGDFNSTNGVSWLTDFINNTGVQKTGGGVDYIFYYGTGVTNTDHIVLRNYDAMSDHEPRFSDFDVW